MSESGRQSWRRRCRVIGTGEWGRGDRRWPRLEFGDGAPTVQHGNGRCSESRKKCFAHGTRTDWRDAGIHIKTQRLRFMNNSCRDSWIVVVQPAGSHIWVLESCQLHRRHHIEHVTYSNDSYESVNEVVKLCASEGTYSRKCKRASRSGVKAGTSEWQLSSKAFDRTCIPSQWGRQL